MLAGSIAMQAMRQCVAGSSIRSSISITPYRGLTTTSKSFYPRQVVRRSVPATEAPSVSRSPLTSRRQDQQSSSQSDLPWYLRAQAETPEGKELEAARRARTRDVNELGEADSALPEALKGLHELLKTGAPSPLIARPDDGEVESETGRMPVTYIHARQHDEQSWCDWMVVVQVRTSSGSAVSRVAREIGAYLQTAKPPMIEGSSIDVKPIAKRPWRPYKILSREAQDGLRTLHAEDPERWSRKALAEAFKMSVESVRRILKSKWQPDSDVVARQNRRLRERREERWASSATHEFQSRESEEVERIRTLIAQSNGAHDQTQIDVEEDLNGDEYRTVNEDGTLADEEEARRQKVRYEGLVSTSHDGQQTQSKSANRVRSGVTRGDGEWCLVDAGWCVVHVMTARARTTYDVERQYLQSHDESI